MGRDFAEPAAAFSTLVEPLRWRALQQPEQRTHAYLIDGEVEGDHPTDAALDLQARGIAALGSLPDAADTVAPGHCALQGHDQRRPQFRV